MRESRREKRSKKEESPTDTNRDRDKEKKIRTTKRGRERWLKQELCHTFWETYKMKKS